MDKKNKAVTVLLSATLVAGCVPAVAMAQAALPDQISAFAEQQTTLRDRVLSGETVYPKGGFVTWGAKKDQSKAAPDGWKPCAYVKNGKVYLEIGVMTSSKLFWTAAEIEEINPDIVITKDYKNNYSFTIEGEFYTLQNKFEGPSPLYTKSTKSVKVDCIEPGTLDSMAIPYFYYTAVFSEFGDVDTHIGSVIWDTDTVTIGKNVIKLDDNWAGIHWRTIKHFIFEKGSKLQSVGKADVSDCGSYVETVEGLPSGVKLKDGALALPNLEKVTKPSGVDYKVPESALKSSDATAPMSKSYWPGALAKARSITMSVTVKKGGKSSFAKARGLKYTKVKVSKLKAGKYKKATKKQAVKITVSKAGKVTVVKGLKKGTYKVKAKATVGGHSKTVTATVKVK